MNYPTRRIGRLWQNRASIKNYEIEKAIKKGGMILKRLDNDEEMFLNVDQLKSALMTQTSKVFPPRFKGESEFRLCNIFWKSPENTNQEKLL
jgi:hypothetical protein|tara:strand:+ start:35 stop:310 length:276 start_codon:yes stop_codon:yes gene_type:complete